MRDEPFNAYADVDREATHGYYDECPEPDERPAREDVADLEPRPPFTLPPGSGRRGGWWLVLPEYRS